MKWKFWRGKRSDPRRLMDELDLRMYREAMRLETERQKRAPVGRV